MSEEQIATLMAYLDRRFDAVDVRISGLDLDIDKRFDGLTDIVDGYASEIDGYVQAMVVMDYDLNRLEKFIQALAAKAELDLDQVPTAEPPGEGPGLIA